MYHCTMGHHRIQVIYNFKRLTRMLIFVAWLNVTLTALGLFSDSTAQLLQVVCIIIIYVQTVQVFREVKEHVQAGLHMHSLPPFQHATFHNTQHEVYIYPYYPVKSALPFLLFHHPISF